MRRLNFSLLTLGALALSTAAHADGWVSVAPNGTVTRTTVTPPANAPRSAAGMIAQQAVGPFPGGNTTTVTSQHYGGYYPGYGYGQQTYTYPGTPYSGPLAPAPAPWARPAWITSIPLGGTYTAPANPYPYPYPAYGYPPVYGYPGYPPTYIPAPVYPYPVYGYPGYGTGSFAQQSGGYSVQIGNTGARVTLGGSSSTTTSTTTTR